MNKIDRTREHQAWAIYVSLLVLLAASSPIAEGRTLSIGQHSIGSHGTITVPVFVSDAAELAGADITLRFNPGILTAVSAAPTPLSTGHHMEYNATVPGEIRVSIAKSTGLVSGSGALVDVVFDVAIQAQIGQNIPLTLAVANVYDEQGKLVPAASSDGAFLVEDTNANGLPDFWDQRIVDADPSDSIRSLADVRAEDDFDGDGFSNQVEYLHGTDPLTVDLAAAIASHPASVTIEGGTTTTLSVVASGTAPLTYQWYQGTSGTTTTPVGTNSDSFIPPPLFANASYWVKVTNASNPSGANSNTAIVTITIPVSSAKDILAFSLPDLPPATISGTNITLTVRNGTDVTALAPTYTLSLWATCDHRSGTAYDFTNPVTYTVLASDLTTKAYTVTVVVATLPPVANGLALWLDAGASGTLTLDGNTVTAWYDQMLSGTRMTVGGGAPTLVASDIGGLPSVYFNTSSWMADGVNRSAGPVTIFYVSRETGAANGRVLSSNANNWLMGYHGGQRNRFYFEGWVMEAGVESDTNPHLYAATIPGSGQASTVWGEGNELTSSTTGTQGPNSLRLNGCPWAELSDCYISEVLVYNRVLSGAELNVVGSYLALKYGLATAYLSSASDIITFGLPDNPGVINKAAKTITLTVPYGTDLTALAPTFTLSAGATCDRVSGTAYDFTNPVAYTVTAPDLTTKVYTVTVTDSGHARLVLTRPGGADADKVLAQVYLDDVPAGQEGLSFRVDYPASILRITGAASLTIPPGGVPAGTTPQWDVAPGSDYTNQTGSVSFAAMWGSSHSFTNGQAVANIVFEVRAANTSQVHFPLELTATEVTPYNTNGPSTPLAVTGQVVTFTRSYADWALATLGNADADPDADADADGQINGLEFAASTNPEDAQSRLQTTAMGLTPAGFTLRWLAVYGESYRVRWSDDLTNWNDLTTAPFLGAGAEVEITDPAPSAVNRFYRVEVISDH
ncbi:MAG: cohesin domain-containing protein [Verrucomicrobia bacterium]|nr:cohesin domain-containing protein [Verrucomicrobiota bacterium]